MLEIDSRLTNYVWTPSFQDVWKAPRAETTCGFPIENTGHRPPWFHNTTIPPSLGRLLASFPCKLGRPPTGLESLRKSFIWGSKIDPTDPESKTVAFYGFDPLEDEELLLIGGSRLKNHRGIDPAVNKRPPYILLASIAMYLEIWMAFVPDLPAVGGCWGLPCTPVLAPSLAGSGQKTSIPQLRTATNGDRSAGLGLRSHFPHDAGAVGGGPLWTTHPLLPRARNALLFMGRHA